MSDELGIIKYCFCTESEATPLELLQRCMIRNGYFSKKKKI